MVITLTQAQIIGYDIKDAMSVRSLVFWTPSVSCQLSSSYWIRHNVTHACCSFFCLERSVARFLSVSFSFPPEPHDSIDPVCIISLVTNPAKSPITQPHTLPTLHPDSLSSYCSFSFSIFLFFSPFYLPWHEHEQCNIYFFHREKRENDVEEVRGANSECQDIQLMSDTIT